MLQIGILKNATEQPESSLRRMFFIAHSVARADYHV